MIAIQAGPILSFRCIKNCVRSIIICDDPIRGGSSLRLSISTDVPGCHSFRERSADQSAILSSDDAVPSTSTRINTGSLEWAIVHFIIRCQVVTGDEPD